MKLGINTRLQSKVHDEGEKLFIEINGEYIRETSFIEIELILKDIRFIRHELSHFVYLYSSQFSFDAHLDRPYWEFLHLKGPVTEMDQNELEEGVLLIFYVWLYEYFEKENFPYADRKNLMEPLLGSLVAFQPDSDIKRQAVELIKRAIGHMDDISMFGTISPSSDQKLVIDQLEADAAWIHKTLVEDYFIGISAAFEPNRKRHAEFGEWLKNNAKGRKLDP